MNREYTKRLQFSSGVILEWSEEATPKKLIGDVLEWAWNVDSKLAPTWRLCLSCGIENAVCVCSEDCGDPLCFDCSREGCGTRICVACGHPVNRDTNGDFGELGGAIHARCR